MLTVQLLSVLTQHFGDTNSHICECPPPFHASSETEFASSAVGTNFTKFSDWFFFSPADIVQFSIRCHKCPNIRFMEFNNC